MTTDLTNLSEAELADILENARKALKAKQDGKRKDVLARIKELGASIGVSVDIIEPDAKKPSSRRGRKVPIKYQNPSNLSEKWSGRGMRPKWLQGLVDQGRDIKDFEVRA